ncbi:MAG: HAMP domain-containing sensor histidine kinase [Candidatus Izemoplasma sp.]|nr:HAMP domain-containing sensor histidine kinase [Candidatus Izemoplasma sp.]
MTFLKIKHSFIKKLFISLALLYLIVFLVIVLFQSTIFESFYTQRTIDSTLTEIEHTLPITNEDDLSRRILDFSQSTQTTTSLVPASSLQEQFNVLQLQIITVLTDRDTYDIYVPNLKNQTYNVDASVTGTLVYHDASARYIPLELQIDDHNIMRSGRRRMNPMYQEFYPDLDTSNTITISGNITAVTQALETPEMDQAINPIISNEILNIVTENYEDVSSFQENGFLYYSTNPNSEEKNIVYVVSTSIDDTPYLFISVFPYAHIEAVVASVRQINTYTFILIFIVLLIAAFVYSKAFSKPLLTLNTATKQLSNLDFSGDQIQLDTGDEFSELADNINALSANLQTTLSQLNEQNKQLSKSLDLENKNEQRRLDFIRGMSHELKTPLSVIQASSEGLEKGVFDNEEDKRKHLKLIQQEVDKTNKMIKDMMMVYRLDTPEYQSQYTQFDIKTLIEDVYQRLKILALNKNLEVVINSESIVLYADRDKLEIVISNLLNNAIKYTPKEQHIIIDVNQTLQNIEVSITNYGVHIPNDALDHLFDPFYRVNKDRRRKEGSTGLGLYIVSQTLKQLNTQCHVENITDGVRFFFTLSQK